MREASPIGAITVARPEPGAFPEQQLTLLQTFADQAVIAIENVRLFNELEARNRELTEALEQQIATGDILRVISRSPTDVQPVFDTIAAAALNLCGAGRQMCSRLTANCFVSARWRCVSPEGAEAIRAAFTRGRRPRLCSQPRRADARRGRHSRHAVRTPTMALTGRRAMGLPQRIGRAP